MAGAGDEIVAARSSSTRAVTELVLAIFRANGAFLSAGDALVADLGLTSARWQVLGAVALEGRPLTVAQAARRMGLSRQAVQRTANDLAETGLVHFIDNPDHKRAKLIQLTERGEAVYAEADRRQMTWAHGLAEGLSEEALTRALDVVRRLDQRAQPENEPRD